MFAKKKNGINSLCGVSAAGNDGGMPEVQMRLFAEAVTGFV